MRTYHTMAEQGDKCALCALPLKAYDPAIRVRGDDESIFCGVNCADKHVCQKSLADYQRSLDDAA